MRVQLPLWAIASLLALSLVVLISLGTWQLFRLRESNALERTTNTQIAAPPLLWDGRQPLAATQVHYRRITVSGEWDGARSLFLSTRVRFGLIGEELITPLRPDGGGPAVLVNRGWYPTSERERVLPPLLSEARAEVSGLGRLIAGPPSRRTSSGDWAWFDVASMAEELPYRVVPWQIVQGTLTTGAEGFAVSRTLPLQTFTAFSTNRPHLAYATTWFGLAAALIATAAMRLRSSRGSGEGSGRHEGAPTPSERHRAI